MSDYDDWEEERREQEEEERQDAYVERAKVQLLELFERRPEEVFYGSQLQVHFEDTFFHWVTSRALEELVDDSDIFSVCSDAVGWKCCPTQGLCGKSRL